MKVTIYDSMWNGCTWFVEVDELTLAEVIKHMKKWFDFQEPQIKWCANNVILRGGKSAPAKKELVHQLKFKESRYSSCRPLIVFEEHWKPNYKIYRYWELGLLENNRITPLWCDEKGNLQKIDFSYRLIGLLVNFEKVKYPYAMAYQGKIFTYCQTQ